MRAIGMTTTMLNVAATEMGIAARCSGVIAMATAVLACRRGNTGAIGTIVIAISAIAAMIEAAFTRAGATGIAMSVSF